MPKFIPCDKEPGNETRLASLKKIVIISLAPRHTYRGGSVLRGIS